MTLAGVIRTAERETQAWDRWFVRLQQVHLILWLTTVVIAIYLLGWPQVVRYNWQLNDAIVIRDLLVLAPVWLPLLCSWAAFYEVEKAAARDDGRRHALPRPSRAAYVWLRARHYLGLCLLPVLILLAVQDLLAWWQPAWQEGEYAWLVYLVPLAGVTLVFPQLLSRIWQTTPLPAGPLRGRLEQLATRLRVGVSQFRIWQTDGQLLNAAVTGFLPALRCVFLTDGLLHRLRDDEVEAIVAHELGHVRRRHLWLRLLLLALPIWILGNLQAWAPEVGDHCSRTLVAWCGSETLVNALLVPALTLTYIVLALGRYSRLLEHDADLCVYEDGRAATFCTTLDRLSYLSNDARQRRTWLHPSTISRIHLLQRAMRDPHLADRFRRRVRCYNSLLLAAWLVPPLLLSLA